MPILRKIPLQGIALGSKCQQIDEFLRREFSPLIDVSQFRGVV